MRGRVAGLVAVAVLSAGLAACAAPAEPRQQAAAPTSGESGGPQPVGGDDPAATVAPAPVLTALAPPEPEPAPVTAGDGFVWAVARVGAADLPSSWREGCPVGPDSLRAVTVGYHDFEGRVRTGVLVLHADVVPAARRAFAALFAQRFPIRSIRPVDEFGGSDDASMAADNTSAFNCRAAVNDSGSTSWSKHAYGRAIDVNPVENPYVLGGRVLPPEGGRYTDRGRPAPGMLRPGEPALQAFLDAGFTWGGRWADPDYQHLQR